MACETLNLWTFSGLVGAFLDLGVAYLLLYASSLAFLASKFLGLFGLYLPCPCDCSFLKAKGIPCWKRALVDHSSGKITSVQLSVKGKYPFDSLWNRDPSFCPCFQITGERNLEVSRVEVDGAGSSNVIYGKRARHLVDRDGIENEDRRQSLHRRRKVVFGDNNVESVLSNDVLLSDVSDVPQPPAGGCLSGNKDNDESFFSVCSGGGKEMDSDKDLGERAEEGECCAEDFSYNLQGKLDFDGSERNSIRRLKEALEEERKALHLELEKERSAAASAADEAMAMILRLQEEKAIVEMEARQYHRMVEEKRVFDTEEMNILKEILLRREMEMHFLEKEVEAYRLTMAENDEEPTPERLTVSSSPSKEDSRETMGVDQLSESFVREEIKMHRISEEPPFLNISVPKISFVSKKVELGSVDLHDKSAKMVAEESILNSTNQADELNPAATSVIHGIRLVHDVHVIGEDAGKVLSMDVDSSKSGSSSLWRSKTEREITSSSWDLTSSGFSKKGGPREKRLVSELRRNSMSAVDCERLKIGSEVGLLMERLKVVQEGRAKLNFHNEHKETETNLERPQ